MGLFDEKKKEKKDIIEVLGGDAPPSYDERVERSTSRMDERLAGMNRQKRAKLYIRLTAAIGALFVVCVVAGALYTCSNSTATSATAAARSTSTTTKASSASTTSTTSEDSERQAYLEQLRGHFTGGSKLTWLSQDELDALEESLLAWLTANGYPAEVTASLQGTNVTNGVANQTYAEVSSDRKWAECTRSDGSWSFRFLDAKPDSLKEAQAEQVATAHSKNSYSSNIKVKLSDASRLKAYIPAPAAQKLSESVASYASAKGVAYDAEKSYLPTSSVTVNGEDCSFGVEVGDGSTSTYYTVAWKSSDQTFSYGTQH